LTLSSGEREYQVTCRVKRNGPRRPPRFIVGIDFGTSSTSVAYLDTRLATGSADDSQSIGLSQRFATAFFLPNRFDDSEWQFGDAAVRASGSQSGLYIPELKSYLRAVSSTIKGPEGWGEIDAVMVLAWFFKQLFKKDIEPVLSSICQCSLDAVEILWRVSIPVFFDDEKSRYEERLRLAFDRSLKTECDRLETVYEPDAALRGVLATDFDEKSKLCAGQTVLIVDSGAGTTDISYGEIDRADDGISVRVSKRGAVSLPSLRASGMLCSDSFGGGDVTRLAASYAMIHWANTRAKSRSLSYERALESLEKWKRITHWMPQSDPKRMFPVDVDSEEYWHIAQAWLYAQAESAKLNVIQSSASCAIDASVTPPLEMSKRNLEFAVEVATSELTSSVDNFIADLPAPPDWIFYLGGNMEFEEFRSAGDRLRSRTPRLNSDIRRLAVVKGLTQMTQPQVEPGVIFISLQDDRGNSEEIFRSNPHALSRQHRKMDLSTERIHFIEAFVERDGSRFRVIRYPIPNTGESQFLDIAVEDARLKVMYHRPPGHEETLYDAFIC